MAASKVLHGARIQMQIGDSDKNNVATVGIFTSANFSKHYNTVPIYVLGAMAPVEILQTGQEAIRVSASGWRVLNKGPHAAGGAKLPKLQDVLNAGYIQLVLWDRQTNTKLGIIRDAKVIGFDGGFAQASAADITVTFMGKYFEDEDSAGDGETANSTASIF